jgi:hypothetical protein
MEGALRANTLSEGAKRRRAQWRRGSRIGGYEIRRKHRSKPRDGRCAKRATTLSVRPEDQHEDCNGPSKRGRVARPDCSRCSRASESAPRPRCCASKRWGFTDQNDADDRQAQTLWPRRDASSRKGLRLVLWPCVHRASLSRIACVSAVRPSGVAARIACVIWPCVHRASLSRIACVSGRASTGPCVRWPCVRWPCVHRAVRPSGRASSGRTPIEPCASHASIAARATSPSTCAHQCVRRAPAWSRAPAILRPTARAQRACVEL